MVSRILLTLLGGWSVFEWIWNLFKNLERGRKFVDMDSVTNFFNGNRNLIESYKKEDICNSDETGLFFKAFDKKIICSANRR
jgi:hypothetical protein